jgi:hypothetical protein
MKERVRLERLIERDGREVAKEWARRTAGLYRQSLSDPAHFASQPDWRPRFEEVLRELENFADMGTL